jgi:hypothetical protein
MSRFALQFMVIIILASVIGLFAPWWTIAIAAFIGGFTFKSAANFLAGFLAIFLLWTAAALVIDITASAPLADRVATIFSLPKFVLFLITGFLGGLVGGFGAATGAALRRDKRRLKYY